MGKLKKDEGRISNFSFSIVSKAIFYISYFWYKILIPFEVKYPKFKMWVYEFIYSVAKIIDYKSNFKWFFKNNIIETKFGRFKIRPYTSDAANISTAFERLDMNFLFNLVETFNNKKIIFLNIGADIRTYTVSILSKFDSIKAYSFEPVEENFSFLCENIKLNNLESRVKTFNYALYKEDSFLFIVPNKTTPGSSYVAKETTKEKEQVVAKRIDSIEDLKNIDFDVCISKIDVEGCEIDVLEGGKMFFSQNKEFYLVVEDFVNNKIIDYLENNEWMFVKKLTTYNSWWKKCTP